jgi:hypothetical protein
MTVVLVIGKAFVKIEQTGWVMVVIWGGCGGRDVKKTRVQAHDRQSTQPSRARSKIGCSPFS